MPVVTALNPVSTIEYDHAPAKTAARKGQFYSATLAGNLTLDATYPNILKLDPAGARDITLDPVATAAGLHRRIINNANAAEDMTVKNVGGDTIGTISQNEEADFYCDGATWSLGTIKTIALS